MGIFRTRTNKKFNYTPRYLDSEGNPFEIKHKFDGYRKTVGKTNLKGKFENAWDDYKNTPDRSANRRTLIIALILLLVFLLIIGFDLSIFLPKG
ncbi:MAG TPA: riboflavin synthase subunit beta [Aquaticitalea sp.]|mgnify:CR=1 FL=1|nr:riboflavin synthase subunit beta [Aquaticitalea sp.]HNU58951.1 riboflavin synthase subunit beta [Aquaticitalea sp.]